MATQNTRPMVSEVSICNQALSWLGVETIITLTDDNASAKWCNENYAPIRDAVIEERMWTFATVRAVPITGDMDEFGVQWKHQIPTSWISVFRVYRNVTNSNPASWQKSEGWRVENGFVLADEPTVYLWGLERVTDTGKFSPLFVQALAARLAADAAIPLRDSRQLQADMFTLYAAKLADATVRDGQQGANETIQSNSLVEARYSGGRGFR